MPHPTLDLFLNLGLAAAAVVVFVSLIRHRAEDYRDIDPSEISEDLAAQNDLLEDVINERSRWEASPRVSRETALQESSRL